MHPARHVAFGGAAMSDTKQIQDFLRLVPSHGCTDDLRAWLVAPHNGTEQYIQIGERQSALFVLRDHWELYEEVGYSPIRVRFCPWCGEELPIPSAKARKVPTVELQAALPHLKIVGTDNGKAW